MNLLATPEPSLQGARRAARPAPVLQLKSIAVPGGRLSLQADRGDIVLLDGLSPLTAWRMLAIAAGYAFSGPGRCEHGGIDTGALDPAARAALRRRGVAHAMQRDALDGQRSLFDNVLDAVLAHGTAAPLARQQAVQALASLGLQGCLEMPAASLSPDRQRLGVLARALACQAPLLIVEQPESGLDESQVAQLQNALWLAAFDARSALLMTTQHPALAALAQRRVLPVRN